MVEKPKAAPFEERGGREGERGEGGREGGEREGGKRRGERSKTSRGTCKGRATFFEFQRALWLAKCMNL